MEELVKKLHFIDMTQQKMYKLFGLRKVARMEVLEEWLSVKAWNF